jgi:hypothetical protein
MNIKLQATVRVLRSGYGMGTDEQDDRNHIVNEYESDQGYVEAMCHDVIGDSDAWNLAEGPVPAWRAGFTTRPADRHEGICRTCMTAVRGYVKTLKLMK